MIDGRFINWTDELREVVGRARQGHLLPSPPFFYVANQEHAAFQLSLPVGEEAAEDDVLIEVEEDQRPPYGVITTQTCDLDRTDQPWIQLSPVFTIRARETYAEKIRQGRVLSLVALTGPDLPEAVVAKGNGIWVADLRIEMPLEKSWLVGRNMMPGFATEEECVDFADRLAGRRARPALATELHELVVNPLLDWLEEDVMRASEIVQVRAAANPSLLEPENARLLILTSQIPLPEDRREAWDTWWDVARERAADAGITLLGNRYDTLQELSAAEYIQSALINFEYLATGPQLEGEESQA